MNEPKNKLCRSVRLIAHRPPDAAGAGQLSQLLPLAFI